MSELTAERLRELLHYNRRTGVFTWRVKCGQRGQVGAVAGSNTNGYRCIKIDGHTYKAHRLAWLITYGVWPAIQIDHINGVPSDNRLSNLREATHSLNAQNTRKPRADNTSGYLGVTREKGTRKWRAQIWANDAQHYLGLFATPEAAHAAYIDAKRFHHPGGTI